MQGVQGADLVALAKAEASGAAVGDYRPVRIPNTFSKIEDKAVLQQTQRDYIAEMMPQQLGVGVKIATELLAMGIRMTLNLHRDHILVTIDFDNDVNEMERAEVLERHMHHAKLNMMVPYRRAKLGPRSQLWSAGETMWHDEGLEQGSPTSSSGFSFTIHHKVKEAGRRLAVAGGCARFGMYDGYMIEPKELIFEVVKQFANGVKEDT
jgi:hypothetical protein